LNNKKIKIDINKDNLYLSKKKTNFIIELETLIIIIKYCETYLEKHFNLIENYVKFFNKIINNENDKKKINQNDKNNNKNIIVKGKKDIFNKCEKKDKKKKKERERKINLFYDRNIKYCIKTIYKLYLKINKGYLSYYNNKNKEENYKSWLLKINTIINIIRIISIFNKIKNAINYINKYNLFSESFFKKYETNISSLEIYNKFFMDLIIFNNNKKYMKYEILIFGGIILRIMNNNINDCDYNVEIKKNNNIYK
jgi:hypothetical protein